MPDRAVTWQANYFEHRLRPDDANSPYARYMFLNPYRAGLIPADHPWPWWRAWDDFDFMAALSDGGPPVEWLSQSLKDLGIIPETVGTIEQDPRPGHLAP
jgi:hypothetical protein